MAELIRDECNLFFVREGDPDAPAVLLVHGIGCQLVEWPPSLVHGLIEAGYQVIRMDNRDAGLSGEIDSPPPEPLELFDKVAKGEAIEPAYTLRDMAGDALAILDHLELPQAHVVGLSMGGMIAQRLAIHYPERVRTLVSIMSTSGFADAPAEPEAVEILIQRPESQEVAVLIAHRQRSSNLIGGSVYKSTEVGFGRFAEAAVTRSYRPAGFARQLAAIIADGSRQTELAGVRAPTLVIHGNIDPLIPPMGGEMTAASIPGARLEVFADMGHDLPEPLMPRIIAALVEHTGQA